MSDDNATFASRVVRWQKAHGRHDLPWQNTRDPYRIWLSEIMLQQTQVATVIPYYHRFVSRFPDLAALAAAPLDAVLTLWSGLGYYSRARHLHRAALEIARQHHGIFPRDYDVIVALPGIGPSTAAAICVFAYGDRRAILEGNVKRLMARHFGIVGYPGDAQVSSLLWGTAREHLAWEELEAYTQGLMDLGAEICKRGAPRCGQCPVMTDCIAYESGQIDVLPTPRPRKVLPQRRTQMLVVCYGDQILLEKRAAIGIWGGLWSLPEAEPGADLIEVCAQRYGVKVLVSQPLPALTHVFTHFKLDIEPHWLRAVSLEPRVAAPATLWLSPSGALQAAIPAPVRRILMDLQDRVTSETAQG